MAIYPRSRIPKWQPPVRITRPYIKPNYLADTINSAIQAYGSVQGTNLKQKMFNAKLKAAQDAKLAQQAYRQKVGSYLTNQANLLGTTSPDTYTSYGGYGMDDVDMTTVPGVHTPNPTISAIAQLWNSGMPLGQATSLAQVMHPQPDPNAQYTALRRQQIQENIDQRRLDKLQKDKIGYDRTLNRLLTGWGNKMVNLEGADQLLAPSGVAKFLQTNPIQTENQILSGKKFLDATLSDFQFLPNWDTGGRPNPGYLKSTPNPAWNEHSATGGTEGFQNWVNQELRPLLTTMIRGGATDSEINNVLSGVAKLIMPKEKGKHFAYRGATGAEIAELIQKHGS